MTVDLFPEFKKSQKADWLKQASKETKQEDVEGVFGSSLWDQLHQLPFYTPQDLESSVRQLRYHPKSELPGLPPRFWTNLVSILPGDSNEKVLDALENGAEGLVLHLNGFEDLTELLKGVLPQYINLLIHPSGNPIQVLSTFFGWVETTGASPESISGGLIWTPSDVVFDRNEPLGLGFEVLSELFEMTEGYPSFKPFCIKTSRYTESGGNPLDALVFGIGELMEVVHSLGKSPREIFSNLFLEASVGENHFGELVRLKAFRRFVASLSGLYSQSLPEEEKDLLLLCQTSSWSKSLVDPHTNLIRQTYEAMSAVLGGANFLWVRPLDEENTGVLERRIARNVSVILREESHLDKVQDPAAGSFFLEKLTTDMLSHLKERLLQLEAGGGWKENLERGEIHREVRKNREKIQDLVLQNSLPKIGVNRYPAPGPFQKSADFEFFSEKNHELNPTRASYLVELQTQTQP